jgi:hypothetical protein
MTDAPSPEAASGPDPRPASLLRTRSSWLKAWIDVDTIRGLCLHASGATAAFALGWLLRLVVGLARPADWVRTFVETTDDFFIAGLFLWLIYQLLLHLWRHRGR